MTVLVCRFQIDNFIFLYICIFIWKSEQCDTAWNLKKTQGKIALLLLSIFACSKLTWLKKVKSTLSSSFILCPCHLSWCAAQQKSLWSEEIFWQNVCWFFINRLIKLSKSAKICRQVSFFVFIIYHVVLHNRNHCAVDKIFDINDIFLDLFVTLANMASFCGHSSCPLGMGGCINGEDNSEWQLVKNRQTSFMDDPLCHRDLISKLYALCLMLWSLLQGNLMQQENSML